MTEPNGRKRIGWIVTWVTLAAAVAGVGIAYASYIRGIRAGEDQAVAQAAVDQKRLADVEGQAQATADLMVENIAVDAMQTARQDAQEKRTDKLIERMDRLIDVLWDRRRSEDARKPGE